MEFFSFYREIEELISPFQTFQLFHLGTLCVLVFLIYHLYRYYTKLNPMRQRRFQKGMGAYFFIEESAYTLWLLWRCEKNVWLEILPLQLCSICAIMAVFAVVFQRKEMRFFCGVIGLFAGLVAIIYPANLSGLYPMFSYRTINFFILHGAFILFGLIQLKEKGIACYEHMKSCTLMLSVLVVFIFFVNINLHTDYMFIGVPSSIGFICQIYEFSGLFFLPIVILVFVLIQWIILSVYRLCMKNTQESSYESKCKPLKNK